MSCLSCSLRDIVLAQLVQYSPSTMGATDIAKATMNSSLVASEPEQLVKRIVCQHIDSIANASVSQHCHSEDHCLHAIMGALNLLGTIGPSTFRRPMVYLLLLLGLYCIYVLLIRHRISGGVPEATNDGGCAAPFHQFKFWVGSRQRWVKSAYIKASFERLLVYKPRITT